MDVAHLNVLAKMKMNQQFQIYVYLLNEGTDVWRPVQARSLGNHLFRITSENDDPEDEEWQFLTGDTVRCEVRMLSNSEPHERLVAVGKI